MTALNEANALYYFEIPLNAGDYAIGSTTNDNTSAYVLYLDIGANGDKAFDDDNNGEDEVVAAHQIEGVTFVDSAAITAKSTEGYSVITFEVAIQSSAYGQNHSGLTVVYNRTSKTAMTVTETDPKNVFDITTIKDDDALSVSGVSPPSG